MKSFRFYRDLSLPGKAREVTQRFIVGVVTVLVALGLVGTASAATGFQTVDVYAVGSATTPRTVTASGPISGVGSVVLGSETDGPDGTRIATTTWVFRDGSVFVTLTFRARASFDSHSCVATTHFTGTWRITGGTGRYAGATGGGTVTGTISAYHRRSASGCTSNEYLRVTRFRYRGIATVP